MGPETPVGQPVLKTMELGPRDRLSQSFWHEQRKGNTVSTRGAIVCCWTCAIWARRRSTSACRWCAICASATSTWTRSRSQSRSGRWCITAWAASIPTSRPPRRCRACSRRANAPASASTAPTGSARTRLTELLVFGDGAALSAIEHIQSGRSNSNDLRWPPRPKTRKTAFAPCSTSATARNPWPGCARK
jgi:fumarate reductase flavoprotein subunit